MAQQQSTSSISQCSPDIAGFETPQTGEEGKLSTGEGLTAPVSRAGYTALGMALAMPEGGVVHACDISAEYPAVGAASVRGRTSEPLAEGSATWQNSWQDTFHFVT